MRGLGPLSNHCTDASLIDDKVGVWSMVDESWNWKWSEFVAHLDHLILLRIAKVK